MPGLDGLCDPGRQQLGSPGRAYRLARRAAADQDQNRKEGPEYVNNGLFAQPLTSVINELPVNPIYFLSEIVHVRRGVYLGARNTHHQLLWLEFTAMLVDILTQPA